MGFPLAVQRKGLAKQMFMNKFLSWNSQEKRQQTKTSLVVFMWKTRKAVFL